MVRVEPRSRRRSIWTHLAWFLIWLVTTIIGALLNPSPHGHGTHQQLGLPPCPSVLLFQRPCPGCGLTTSFSATIQGRWAEAFAANAFGPILYGLMTLTALVALYGFLRSIYIDTDTVLFNRVMTVIMVSFIIYGIVHFATTRMYPFVEPRIGSDPVPTSTKSAEEEASSSAPHWATFRFTYRV